MLNPEALQNQENQAIEKNDQGKEENLQSKGFDDKGSKDRLKMFSSLLEETIEESLEETLDEIKNENLDDKKKGSESSEPVKTLTDAAKKLGIEVSDIYKLSLKLRDSGEPVTIGALKDFYQEGDDLDLKKIEWGEQKIKEEQELVRARQEIEVLASLLPKDALKKESLEQARDIVQKQLERQRGDLLRRVPEWNNEEVRKSEIAEIDKHLEGYGISFKELKDSRLAHYIRNNWLREQRINKALEKVKEVKTPTASPNSKREGRKVGKQASSAKAESLSKIFLTDDF